MDISLRDQIAMSIAINDRMACDMAEIFGMQKLADDASHTCTALHVMTAQAHARYRMADIMIEVSKQAQPKEE